MAFDGAGTKNSPIFIQDSEEEIIQELSYQQFYAQYSTQKPCSMAGKRKSREDDESVADARSNTLTPSTSLESRISQPESKKARKRRRKAEKEAWERKKMQNIDWTGSLPPAAGPSQPAPPLQARVKTERQYPDFLEGVLRENQTDMVFRDYDPPPSSAFDSDWVSSMIIAGEFPHCKVVKTSTNLSPRPAPRPLPTFPPSLAPPEVLPPIHIHPDLVVSSEAPVPTHPPKQTLPQTIGMKPDQEPNSKHGIFHITDFTKEAGSRMNKRKNPYIPNSARTLVMEKLPKTHRTTDFVTDWCCSVCGVPPHHLFVDPPSAKALIEFGCADLARKAWASPRLGHGLLGKKSSLLKGMPREDQIRVWWYRADGVDVGAGVREIEEGEIEEDRVTENRAPHPPSSPRKESKKERKAKLAKQRETKAMKNQQQQKQKQKNPGSLSNSMPTTAPAPSVNASTPTQVQATSSQVHIPPAPKVPPAFPFDPIIGNGSLYPHAQSWPQPSTQLAPQVQPTNSHISTPSPYLKTGVGSSLAPGARGGHDDSASIASSGGRSSPECHWFRKTTVVVPSSKIVMEATTVGQADGLADYSEVDMEVDSGPSRDGVGSKTALPPTSEKATSSTAIQSSTKGKTTLQTAIPTRPRFISGTLREKPRSKQLQSHPRSHFARTPILATAYRPAVPPFILKNGPLHQLQPSSPVSSLSGLPPISHVPNSSQYSPFSSIPSKFSASVPIPGSNTLPPSGPKGNAHISVLGKWDKQVSKSELVTTGNPTASASAPAASSPVSIVPASIAPSPSNSHSAGQAMEENLRQLVFASKRARFSGLQPHSSQRHSSTSADVNMTLPVHHSEGNILPATGGLNREQSNKVVSVETPASPPPSATCPPTSNSTSLKQSTADTFSFEDLAITFITQTIENVKANNINQPQPDPQSADASSTSTPTSASEPPSSSSASSNTSVAGITPDKLPLATHSSMTKSELSAKQSRLDKHLQESKILMERLSTAKTKREKDLLLKIMNEKMRLFEEETKASEKKTARLGNHGPISIEKSTKGKTQTTTVLQFQQWPTIQSDPILVLSDDEE